jgi:hypothetical protein
MPAKETGIDKRKKRKPTKVELKIKFAESIPVRERWWTVWSCEPSHTVASIVSELPTGGVTEEIWDMAKFERQIKTWMVTNKDKKYLSPNLFTK